MQNLVGTAGLVALITPASGAIPLGKTDAAYTCLYGAGGQFQQWLVTVPSLVIQLALVPNGGQTIADLLGRYGITMAPGKPDVLLVNATLQSNDTSVVCTIVVNGTAANSDTVVITVFGKTVIFWRMCTRIKSLYLYALSFRSSGSPRAG